MAKQQATLVTIWSKDNSVKRRRQDSVTVECAGVVEDAAEDFPTEATEIQAECDPRALCVQDNVVVMRRLFFSLKINPH